MEDTRTVLADIGHDLPDLRAQAQRLLRALIRCASRLRAPSRTVLLHGSFRLNHVFIDEGALTLLDLDGFRKGEPAYDLATFFSSLHHAEEEDRLDSAACRQLTRLFLRGYAAAVPWSLDPPVLLWFLANLLINKQARKYLRHADAQREKKLRRMLGLAEAAVSRAAAVPANVQVEELTTLV